MKMVRVVWVLAAGIVATCIAACIQESEVQEADQPETDSVAIISKGILQKDNYYWTYPVIRVQGFSHNRRMAQDLTEFLNSTDTDLNSKYFYWVEVEEK